MIDLHDCIEDSKSPENDGKEFNKVAKIHKYWSRKPFHLVESCIRKYSDRGDVVLDPFCGSGSTGLGCTLNERTFIGYDLNPAAIFISDCTLDLDYSRDEFVEEMDILSRDVKDTIMELYSLGDGEYILYSLSGRNEKDYNAVTCDNSFRGKRKKVIPEEVLHRDYKIPETLKYPDKPFPEKFYKDRFSYKGVVNVSDMFTGRNLYALAILYDYIVSSNFRYRKLFLLAFSNTILHVSRLKGENVRPLSVNNYWIPDDYIEENVIWRYLDRLNNIVKAKEQILKKAESNGVSDARYELYNKSSLELEEIAADSIDYIITDPPYGDAIQYSELSYIWNCWLELNYETEQEVIINPVQNKGIAEFQSQIRLFVRNAYRVLKEGGAFTLCFQNKDPKIWLEIIRNIRECGFELDDIKIYDTLGSPYNKHWAKFSPKADLYVTFRKADALYPDTGNIDPEEIIEEVVSQYDPSSLDMNKGYDLFVAAAIMNIFKGKQVDNIQKWSLKRIVKAYESKLRSVEGGHNKDIQEQLSISDN